MAVAAVGGTRSPGDGVGVEVAGVYDGVGGRPGWMEWRGVCTTNIYLLQ